MRGPIQTYGIFATGGDDGGGKFVAFCSRDAFSLWSYMRNLIGYSGYEGPAKFTGVVETEEGCVDGRSTRSASR